MVGPPGGRAAKGAVLNALMCAAGALCNKKYDASYPNVLLHNPIRRVRRDQWTRMGKRAGNA